jgi:hypothetical protein
MVVAGPEKAAAIKAQCLPDGIHVAACCDNGDTGTSRFCGSSRTRLIASSKFILSGMQRG